MAVFNPAYPTIPQSRRPTISSPLCDAQKQALGVSTCGDTLTRDIQIRCPYQGHDGHYWNLPALVTIPLDQLENTDPGIFDRIRDAALSAKRANFTFQGVIPSGTENAVANAADQALSYLASAEELWNWWEEYLPPPGPGFGEAPPSPFGPSPGWNAWSNPTVANVVRGWPIAEATFDGMVEAGGPRGGFFESSCDGPEGTIFTHRMTGFGGTTDILYRCPSSTDWDLHRRARNAFRFLLEHAARWARCAQEEAITSGIHGLNKRDVEAAARPGIDVPDLGLDPGTFAPSPPPAPPTPTPRPTFAPIDDVIVGPQPPIEPPRPTTPAPPMPPPAPPLPPEPLIPETPDEEMPPEGVLTPEEQRRALEDSMEEPSPDEKIEEVKKKSLPAAAIAAGIGLVFLFLRKKR